MMQLRELLQEPVAQVIEREQTMLDRLIQERGGKIVLFGAGSMGKRAIAELRSIGIEPLCVCDNNPKHWGTTLEGCTLLSPKDATARYGSDALFLVTIWNAAHWFVETLDQLKDLGCKYISCYSPLYWRFSNTFLPFLLNDHPHKVYEDAERVLQAETLWADDISLQAYRSHIHWYATGDASHLPRRPQENTYFPEDIFSISPAEVVVDCGAFDGDTIRQVVDKAGDRFSAVHAIEADPLSLDKLDAYLQSLPPVIREKIKVHSCAVCEERTTLRFEVTGSVDSRICEEGGVEVDGIPLDDLFSGTPVTMIKMDIEGAEFGALLGGRKTIQRDKPILAICVYHTQNDIWRIPLLIHEMLPAHKLYLRAYEGDGFQTVFYAVPPERVKE